VDLENRLRKAVDRRRVVPALTSPSSTSPAARIVGLEALDALGWDPTGIRLAGKFVPVLEQDRRHDSGAGRQALARASAACATAGARPQPAAHRRQRFGAGSSRKSREDVQIRIGAPYGRAAASTSNHGEPLSRRIDEASESCARCAKFRRTSRWTTSPPAIPRSLPQASCR